MLKNLVYTGKVVWGRKNIKKSTEVGKVGNTVTRPKKEWTIANGKYPALVSEELFEKTQEILNKRYHVPYQLENGITNPLAGLIRCENCGASMVLKPYPDKDHQVMCYNNCGNKSSKLKYVEKEILAELAEWCLQYRAQWDMDDKSKRKKPKFTSSIPVFEKAVENLEKELVELENPKNSFHNFLERGIYDVDTYLERSQNLATKIDATKVSLPKAKLVLGQEMQHEKAQTDIIKSTGCLSENKRSST